MEKNTSILVDSYDPNSHTMARTRTHEHHGVYLTAEIRDWYPDPVNTLIIIFYSLSSKIT
jgi:hypothetical protein